MEHEERKIAKGYAIIALYTIILLVVGILLGFAVGRQSVISEREIQQSDTTTSGKCYDYDIKNDL